MMMRIKQNFISILLLGFALVGFHSVDAQASSEPVSNINLDFVGKSITGNLESSVSRTDTEVYLTTLNGNIWDTSVPKSILIRTLSAGARSFSFEFDSTSGSNTLKPELSTSSYSNIAADKGQEIATYSDILFKNNNISGGYSSYSLQSLQGGNGATNSVKVDWGEITLETDSATGLLYHDITSDGLVVRDQDVPIYLTITKSGNGAANQHITLCVIPEGGKEVIISFPLCAGFGSLQESPIEFGYEYKLFFSNQPNSSFVINSTDGDGVIDLPSVPDPNNGSTNQPVTITSKVVKSKSGKAYYEIKGTVNATNLDSDEPISFMVREKGTNNNPILLGKIPFIKTGNNFITPSVSELTALQSLRIAEYELLIMRYGQPLQDPIALPPVSANIDNNPADSNDNYYNETQEKIIKKGIVGSIDCGYDIGKDGKGRICGFSDFITLIQRVIEYIFILVLPIMAIVFAYAGYLFLTSGGSETKRTAAKKAMTSALIGVIIIMAAWLLVKTVLVSLGVDEGASWFFLAQ
jgi:hypothetical protein